MEIFLFRHGKTGYNLEGRYLSETDLSLTREGIEELSPAGFNPGRVYTSPYLRTKETAEILFPGCEQVEIPEFSEMNFGIFEGKTAKEMEEDPNYQAFVDSFCELPIPGGECRKDFCKRVTLAFLKLLSEQKEEPLVLVVHGGTIMAICEAFGEPKKSYFDYHIPCGKGYKGELFVSPTGEIKIRELRIQ